MGQWMDGFVQRLQNLYSENALGGGEEKQDHQHALGKLTVRERIDLLFDSDSFMEAGGLTRDVQPTRVSGQVTPGSACDGVVVGFGRVDGRQVAVCGTDFTVFSGTLGNQGSWKMADFIGWAGKMRMPLVMMFDSSGERYTLKRGDVGFDGFSRVLRNLSTISGLVPTVGLVLGPCTGLMAYAANLCNFLIMNEKSSFMWLGGERQDENSGRGTMHMEQAGQCDLLVNSDEKAIAKTQELLSYLPTHCFEKAPVKEVSDPVDRTDDALLEVMPDDPRYTYDIHEIIELIVDHSDFFELKDEYAPHLVIGFARLGGQVVGIVANNCDEWSGVLEMDSSDKYQRFMTFLDAFNIPLLNMVDTSGFVPGDSWERRGILRHGAKLLHAYTRLTVPKLTLQLRRSYGGGNIVMGGRGMSPDLIVAWPTAEYAPTGAETVLQSVFNKELAQAKEEGNYDEIHDRLLKILQDQYSVLTCANFWTNLYTSHVVINPKDTRPVLIRALEVLSGMKKTLPEHKRGIVPA